MEEVAFSENEPVFCHNLGPLMVLDKVCRRCARFLSFIKRNCTPKMYVISDIGINILWKETGISKMHIIPGPGGPTGPLPLILKLHSLGWCTRRLHVPAL